MGAEYHFFTVWRVPATVEEVMAVLGDAEALVRWWPSVYLGVTVVDAGGADAVGRTLDLHTKGWLPYTLRWRMRITEPITDRGFALAATGDLEGTGRWTFDQDGPGAVVTYDWRVRANKPLLRRLGRVLEPVFSANHHWAMNRGEESLALEIRRRRADSEEARSQVPDPPPPTWGRRRRR